MKKRNFTIHRVATPGGDPAPHYVQHSLTEGGREVFLSEPELVLGVPSMADERSVSACQGWARRFGGEIQGAV